MDDLKALFPVCKEIKKDGIRCGSPAMKGMNFCFNHIGGKPAAFIRAQATTTYKTDLNLAHPGTREAIQHNLALVADAMNQGKIDAQTAKAYIRLYSIAEQNLTRWEKAHKNDPDKQMLPLFEAVPETDDDVILSEVGAPPRANEAEEPEVSAPDAAPGAPCLAETWDHNSNQRSEAPSVPSVVNPSQDQRENPGAPSFAQRRVGERENSSAPAAVNQNAPTPRLVTREEFQSIMMSHDEEFREIERRYQNDPERIRAAIESIRLRENITAPEEAFLS